MGSSMDFFDIPTTVWNISMMMSIYVVVLSTSTDLLTHSSTCFIFNHIYDVDLRTLSFFYVLLHCTYTWFRYISTMLIYVLFRFSSFYVLLVNCTYTWFWNVSTMFITYVIQWFFYVLFHFFSTWFWGICKMLIYVLLLFFYVLYNFCFYVILEHIYVLLPTWKFVFLRTFEKART